MITTTTTYNQQLITYNCQPLTANSSLICRPLVPLTRNIHMIIGAIHTLIPAAPSIFQMIFCCKHHEASLIVVEVFAFNQFFSLLRFLLHLGLIQFLWFCGRVHYLDL
jgi:hypothetical protein